MSLRKTIGYLTVILAVFSACILSFPIPVSAAPAWTNAWTVVDAADGPANPFAIAADWEDTVYVTNGNEIKKLAKGSSSWQAIAKNGLSATPDGIAVDKNRGLYITDCSKSVVQHLESGSGEWRNIGGKYATQIWIPTYWSDDWGWVDGHWENSTAFSGGIYFPYGVAVDYDLNVYVANPGDVNYAEYYNSLAMLREGEWSILGASYGGKVPCYIADVAADNSGNVYVTTQHSSGTNIGQDSIRKLSDGVWSTIPGTYNNDPINPGSIAVDDSGRIYVVSEGDRTVKVYAEGQWTSISGDGIGGPQYPTDIAIDGSGNIYVTDRINKKVWRQQSPATRLVWLPQPTDGVAGRTWETPPRVLLMDKNGNVEKDVSNHTVTLSINSGNGASLSGATATLQNGIATFSNLTVNKAGGGYTLTPSCSLSPNLAAQSSNAFNMAAPALPQVTGISPAKGIGGTEVTVTGTNLTAASLVEFGEMAGVNLFVVSDTEIKVTAPAQGAGTVNVWVTTPGGESATYGQFTYNQPGAWAGAWTTVEGPPGGLNYAQGLAIDNDDNIYVVDSRNNNMKKLGGGSWSAPVSGLDNPSGVAVDASGNTYVADYGNYRIMKNDSVMINFDSTGWGRDMGPRGVAVDASGNVYATVTTSSGEASVLKWNGSAWSDITYDGGFDFPLDVAADINGNVYVVDSYLNAAKKLPAGTSQWITIGSGFSYPTGIAVNGIGNVYIADFSNNVIKELRVGSSEWMSIGGDYRQPYDVALDSQGNLYVTAYSSVVSGNYLFKHNAPATRLVWDTQPGASPAGQVLKPYPKLTLKDANGNIVDGDSTDTVTLSLYSDNGATLEGTTAVKMVNGTADFVDLKISGPGSGYILVPSCSLTGIAISNSNSFNITDAVTPTPPLVWMGGWTTIGSPAYGFGYSSSIYGITVDDDLKVYAVDRNIGKIRKLDGGIWNEVLTVPDYSYYGIALHGDDIYTAGFSKYNILKNGIEFANFNSGAWGYFMPYDVAADKSGNIYTVGNGYKMKVLKYDGSTWSSIDYHGSFSYPEGIAVDNEGNLYVADSSNKDIKLLPAGTRQWITIGTGFAGPEGISVDNSGNVYVADGGAIKVLTAGSGQWASIPTSGTSGANDVAVDKFGNVYASYNYYVYKHQAPAARLVWETQPGGGLGRKVWDQQPVVSLKDAGGNTQTGDSSSTVTVTLSPSKGATLDGIKDSATVTLNKGVATFSGLKADKPGTYTLTLSSSFSNDSIECPESASFDIISGPVDSSKSEVVAGKTDVIADNSDSAAITVTLKDEYGNPVSGKTAELTQGSGSSVISTVDSITDGGGSIVFWVKGTKAETVTYTAKDTTDNLIIAQTAQISFKAGAVNAVQSTVEPDKTVVAADDLDCADITITLKDAYGNPVQGKTATLSQEEGSSDISPASDVSDDDGKVTFTVKNTKAETISYTVTGDGVPLTGFQLTFKAGPPKEFIIDTSGTQSAGAPFDVTVTVKDQYGNTVTDYTGAVSFSTDNGNSPGGWAPVLPEDYSFTLADAGIHSFSSGVTLYNASISVLTAVDGDDSSITGKKEGITVNAGTTDAVTTTAVSGETIVTANGSDDSTITVTVKDAYGNPLGGKTVVLEQGSGSSVITTVHGISQADGTAAFVVKSTKAEKVTYTVKVDGTSLDVTAAIDFIPGAAETLNIIAAGAQTANIPFDVTVTVRDHYGNTVTGYTGTIQLTSTDAKAVLPGSHIFLETDKGVYTFSGVILKTAGVQTVTATDTISGSITGTTGNIIVAAGNDYAAKSTIAAGKPMVTADGIDSTTITVTLKDDYDNLISGKPVILSQGEGSSVVEAVYGTTRLDGTAVFTVTDTKAEQVTYTAKVNGAAVNRTVQVTFIPGPAESLITSDAGTQKAGEPFSVTVTAKDKHGNTATGYRGTVQLSSTDAKGVLPGSHTFAEADNGIYVFGGVILKTAGAQTVTATDTINGSITGTTGNITVNVSEVDVVKSEVSVGKATVTADGVDSAVITVTLADAYGNPVSGRPVTLSKDTGSSVTEAVYGATRIDGTEIFIVKNTVVEQVTYTATAEGKALSQTVIVFFVPGSAKTLGISAVGTQAAGTPFDMTVTARDQCGNTATDYSGTVQLTSTDTKAVLPGSHTFTAANKGIFKFKGIILKTAGTHILTVADVDNGSITGATGSITVSAGSGYKGLSTIAADKSSVAANGKDNASITVALRDSYGNSLSGKIVTLSQGTGSSVVEAVYGTSRSDGTALFTVASTKAETVNYTAMVDGKAATEAVEVTFTPGAAARLEWKIQPGGGAGGQIWPQQPVLVLQDSYGNVNTGDSSSVVTVELKKSNGATLQGSNSVTLKNGEAAFNDLRIAKKGSYKLTPTIDMEGIDCPESNTFRISMVPAPYIDPMGGTFLSSVTVSIDYSEECEAYYNLSGEDPTRNATFYQGPFSLFSNSTVTAAVYDAVYGDWSSITTADFTIRLEIPTANPADGSIIPNNSTVTLSSNKERADIYYTTDGSTPNTGSPRGSSVMISGAPGSAVTVKAYAVKSGYGDSEVAVFRYTIQPQTVRNDDEKEAPPVRTTKPDSMEPVPEADGSGKVSVTVLPRFDSSTGTASAAIDSVTLANAFNVSKAGEDGTKTVSLVIPKVNGATAYESILPASFLGSGDAAKSVEIKTDIAVVTVPGNMLPTANLNKVQNVSLTIAVADRTKLDAGIQAQIGNRPLIELNLKLDGQRVSWSNEAAPVTVSIAYTPTAEELADPEHITVWYIDGSGNAVSVPSGRYDPSTGRVTFTTTHFSKYAVAFVWRTFTDLSSHDWARKPIEVLASKGIMDSTAEESFYPAESIKRADYLMMLIRTLGLSADFNENFDDVKAGSVYYKEIGVARKLGITSGIGGNKFNPSAPISRQDMMVLAERALSSLKKISQKGPSAELERFMDKDTIAAYAASSMASLVREGLIKGSGGKINPLSDTTRAEAAVFLYRIYNME